MKWPRKLVLIRHGESEFNVLWPKKQTDPEYQELKKLYEEGIQNGFQFTPRALELAKTIQERYNLPMGEADTPLTQKGFRQASKTGEALRAEKVVPDIIFVSPYLRAKQTLEGIVWRFPELEQVRVIVDGRIRERNIGELELYGDPLALNVLKPKQAKLLAKQGAYHYRFPQGESVEDVNNRNRHVSETITRDHSKKIVWVISHGNTILSLRSLYESWEPEQYIKTEIKDAPRNCSLTIYRGEPMQGEDGRLVLESYNQVLY